MLARMWNKRNSHLLLVGMQNGTAILEDKQFLTKLSILLPSTRPDVTTTLTVLCVCVCVCVSRSVVSDSLRPHRL